MYFPTSNLIRNSSYRLSYMNVLPEAESVDSHLLLSSTLSTDESVKFLADDEIVPRWYGFYICSYCNALFWIRNIFVVEFFFCSEANIFLISNSSPTWYFHPICLDIVVLSLWYLDETFRPVLHFSPQGFQGSIQHENPWNVASNSLKIWIF